MARRKANGLENQMSLMDMMASESPEYAEEDPAELLDTGEDMGDSEGQTDKPFKRVANKTTKAKASISTQTLKVVKALYTDTVETNWEDLFDGFDRLYAITFSSGIEFVNKVINKFSYAEVVFGCEKIIANDIAAIMSVQIDSVQRLAKSKSAGNLANRLNDGSLQLYVSRDTKSHEKIFILESADHKHVRVITGSANMSASAFYGIQRENIVCFDDEAAFAHYKILFDTFKETCSDNVSYKAVVNTMDKEDYLKENIEEVPVFQSIEKQKYIFLEQAQPEDEIEYEIVADVKKMQELVKPIMPKMPVKANRVVVAPEPMRVFAKRYSETRRVAAETVKEFPKLHIDYDAGTMAFNGENIDLNPNLSDVTKNIKSIQKFFSGMDYFYGDVEQAKKDYFKYMTWYLATPFMAYLRYFASRNNYDTKLFPLFGVMYGKEYFPDIFYASSSVIADIFRVCKIDLPVYAHILSYDDYMGDKSIGRAAIEKIELAWQADPNKFRVDKKKNRLIYSYPQDGPWYELKYIADELPNSLEAEISGGNQLVMNYEQAQELFGIKFRRWLGIFNL